jgi:hypothetical protein
MENDDLAEGVGRQLPRLRPRDGQVAAALVAITDAGDSAIRQLSACQELVRIYSDSLPSRIDGN